MTGRVGPDEVGHNAAAHRPSATTPGSGLPTIGLSREQVFGLALGRRHGPQDLVAERSDGQRSVVDLDWWRADPSAAAPADTRALELATEGPVLDAWCRTGRRLELLAARGLPGRGIDTCEEAVAMGLRLGRVCVVADVHRYWPPLEFGTVLALDGAVGRAGTLDRLPALLSRLAALVFPGGAVLAGSVDWRVCAAQDARFLDRQRRDQRYPGEVRLRLRYGPLRSAWYDWVWVDRDAMIAAARSAGLAVTGIWSWRHHYVARLVRPPGWQRPSPV
jgi:SAM-dependent methyltransferase